MTLTRAETQTVAQPPTCDLLGWPIVNLRLAACLDLLQDLVARGHTALVFTPNVDHLRLVQIDAEACQAFRAATLLLPDGVPLLWATRWLGRPLAAKLSGSDIFPLLMERCSANRAPVYLIGGVPGGAQEALAILHQRLGRIEVAGFECPPLGFEKDDRYSQGLAARISASGARLLVACMGTPKTEKWICAHRDRLQVGLAVSFGAAIDFTTGRVRRAPRWMQRVGLEWLWRLILEPRRMYKRYLVRDPGFFLDVFRQWRSERQRR